MRFCLGADQALQERDGLLPAMEVSTAPPPDPDLDAVTSARLKAFRDGEAAARSLVVADLEVGSFGVLDVVVRHVHAPRPFTRRDGREGLLRRVTLGDATGEVDLVLWGDECGLAVDGPLAAGAAVRLRGPTIKAGYRGGIELHLGSCVLEPAPAAAETVSLEGTLESVAQTRIHGAPPNVRFQAEAVLATATGSVHVVLWDQALRTARQVLPGTRLRVQATPHPALDGWFEATVAVQAMA